MQLFFKERYISWLCMVSFVLLSLNFQPAQSENILVLLPLASKSHKNVFQPFVEALAERGHNLTVVSPFMPSKEKKNIREIVPTKNFAAALSQNFGNPFENRAKGKLAFLTGSFDFIFDGCREALASEKLTDLSKEKFDLIYLDAFMNDCLAGFIYKLGAPLILVTPMAAPRSITEHTGTRLPASFVPFSMLPFKDEMSFLERLTSLSLMSALEFFGTYFYVPKFQAIYQNMDPDLPGIADIYSNVSLILQNSHFTLTFPRPTLPDVIEVGGMHCRPTKPLPKDLEEFISGGKDGVIFFSLGSIVQGNQMPEKVRKIFLNVFSRLKQRVLWKWESGEMPDLPKNVKLGKWLPQQDIIGHKNVILFMTHGGLLSTQEAAYHGVPLIGIPIFGDQDLNTKQAERAGYALTIEILEMTEESLEQTINEMLTNKKYTERAQKLSELFRDQSETPLERAVFWSEYVMRHKGAHHLRSAARKLNFFQYHSLDVIAFITTILVIILWLVKIVTIKLYKIVLSAIGKDKCSKSKEPKGSKKSQ